MIGLNGDRRDPRSHIFRFLPYNSPIRTYILEEEHPGAHLYYGIGAKSTFSIGDSPSERGFVRPPPIWRGMGGATCTFPVHVRCADQSCGENERRGMCGGARPRDVKVNEGPATALGHLSIGSRGVLQNDGLGI